MAIAVVVLACRDEAASPPPSVPAPAPGPTPAPAPVPAEPDARDDLVPIYRDLALGETYVTLTCASDRDDRRITEFDLEAGRIWVQDVAGKHHRETRGAIPADQRARARADLAAVLAGGPYAPERGAGPRHCTLALTTEGAMDPFFHIEKDGTATADPLSQLVRDLGGVP